MRYILYILFFMVVTIGIARAGGHCLNGHLAVTSFSNTLQDKYGESMIWELISQDKNQVVLIFLDYNDRSWTVLIRTLNPARTCIVASGTGFVDRNREL